MSRSLHLALAFARPRAAVPDRGVLDPSTTRLRVLPTDLDVYLHVNNGTYLQMMDVGRTNYLADLGAFGPLREHGWYPVVAASTMTYKRSLRLGDRVELVTRLMGWDERVVYVEQTFWHGADAVARGWVAGRFLGRHGVRVPAPEVIALLEPRTTAPELPEEVASWARAVDVAHRSV